MQRASIQQADQGVASAGNRPVVARWLHRVLVVWAAIVLVWIASDGFLSFPGSRLPWFAGVVEWLQLTAGLLVLLAGLAIPWLVWRSSPDLRLRQAALVNVLLAVLVAMGMSWSPLVAGAEWWLRYAHGCLAPLFFAASVGLATVTSPRRRWIEVPSTLKRMAPLTFLVVLAQVMLGALVRYLPITASPNVMRPLFLFHLVMAGAVVIHLLWLVVVTWRRVRRGPLMRWTGLLGLLILFQISLGICAWVTNYGWPAWLDHWPATASHIVRIGSNWSSTVIACHISNGALVLAVTAILLLTAIPEITLNSRNCPPTRGQAAERRL